MDRRSLDNARLELMDTFARDAQAACQIGRCGLLARVGYLAQLDDLTLARVEACKRFVHGVTQVRHDLQLAQFTLLILRRRQLPERHAVAANVGGVEWNIAGVESGVHVLDASGGHAQPRRRLAICGFPAAH